MEPIDGPTKVNLVTMSGLAICFVFDHNSPHYGLRLVNMELIIRFVDFWLGVLVTL